MVSKYWKTPLVAVLLLAFPFAALAGPCDAYFSFDGTLADTSGNGNDGEMIAAGGAAARPAFTAGKFGRALQLDGTAAMRALLDLHYDTCPQVTISAWINVARDAPADVMHVLSTGNGSGPGLTVSGTFLQLHGTENGIGVPNAVRKGSWMFVAGVYDYSSGGYALYWSSRGPTPGRLSEYRYPPENAFWVGTVNDDWGIFARAIAVDELRITASTLSSEAVAELRAGSPTTTSASGVTPLDGSELAVDPDINVDRASDLIAGSTQDSDWFGRPCASHADCESGGYCGWDRMCHPETHAPMQDIQLQPGTVPFTPLELPPDTQQAAEEDPGPTGPPRPVGTPIPSAVSGAESKTTKTVQLADAFINLIDWGEKGDRPCRIQISNDGGPREALYLYNCASVTSSVFASAEMVAYRPSAGSPSNVVDYGIRSLSVCNNNNANKRMKGLQISGYGILADGSTEPQNFVDSAELSNCDEWGTRSSCDATRLATGLIVHYTRASGRNEQIVGLQVLCSRIGFGGG